MIKLILLKPYDLKIYTVVITVTFNTFFAFNLRRCMITFLDINTSLEFVMTFQTLLIGYFFPQDVAFGAV